MGRETTPQQFIRSGMIDSHFHSIIMREKGLDPEALLAESERLGFSGGLDIGISAGDIAERFALSRRFPQIRLAAGLYPSESAAEDVEEKLHDLARDLGRYFVSAVGEIGVDLHWNYAEAQRQMDVMARQIDLANTFELPVVIHNRKADREVIEVLNDHTPVAGGIMHCFSGGPYLAREAIELGLYISFAGNVTYKKSETIKAAAREVPESRLLVETDSPSLSPQAVRGTPNHPGHIGLIYETLAEIRNVPEDTLISQVRSNFEELFPLS
jgi:TatD DNase family protein